MNPAWQWVLRKNAIFICLLYFSVWCGSTLAANLEAEAGRVPLAGHMAVLHDRAGELSLQDVLATSAATRFVRLPGNLSAGYVRGDVWLRFELKRLGNAPTDWWLEVPNPLIDEVSLFVPVKNGKEAPPTYQERRAGEQVPKKLGEVNAHRQAVFRLTLTDDQPQTLFLKLRSVNALVTEPTVWSDWAFAANSSREDAFLVALFMMLAAVTLTGLIIGLTAWDRGIIVSSTFNVSLLMILLPNEGFLQLYLFPGYPGLPDVLIGTGLAVNFYTGWEVLVKLGGLGDTAPRFAKRIGLAIGIFALPMALISAAGHYGSVAPIMQTIGQIEGVVVIVTTLALVIRGNHDAKIFFLPYVTYSVLAMTRLGRNLGWFPANALTEHGFHLGVLIQSVSLVSIAIYRLNRLRAEREDAQAQKLRMSQSHERELESRVNERTAELTRAIEDQRQLLAMVSHEFRNPLAVVDGAAQNIERGIGGEASLQQIRRAVERMSQLLVNVLAEDRLADKVRQTNMQPTDLVCIARSTLELRSHGVAHSIKLLEPNQEAFVIGDEYLLRIALDNLLDNAIKYAPDGPIRIVIEPVIGAQANWRLAVQDSGTGIPPNTNVFAKYVRGNVQVSTPGAGLGLFLVARIAELHKGSVTARNWDSGGAEVALLLPQASPVAT